VPTSQLIEVIPTDPVAGVLSAVAASAVTALGTGMQQRATLAVPDLPNATTTLLTSLVRRPLWLAGVAIALGGFLLYLYALANAALTLAQPIMVGGVVFGPIFSAWLARRRVDRPLLVGGALCGVGLGTFLLVSRPTSGTAAPSPADALPLSCLVVLIVFGAAWIATARRGGLNKAIVLAVVAAVLFGVNAGLSKVVAGELSHGWLAPLQHPTGYAMLLSGCAAFLVSQRAMQLARLLAPVIVVISTIAPLTASLIGVLALGERLEHTPAAVLGELACVLIVVAGIRLVAARAALLLEKERQDGQAPGWG
jgi:drug/metabolite transporter (DMT)-like permease